MSRVHPSFAGLPSSRSVERSRQDLRFALKKQKGSQKLRVTLPILVEGYKMRCIYPTAHYIALNKRL
jgi:hypothetical protein